MTNEEINAITGLVFCDEDCGCGENNQLWWSDAETPERWREYNGVDTYTIERSIVADGE